MSGLGKWSLGVGIALLAVAVLCSVLDLIPVSVITGVVGLVALSMAGYDAINSWLERVEIRRGAAKARREREAR